MGAPANGKVRQDSPLHPELSGDHRHQRVSVRDIVRH